MDVNSFVEGELEYVLGDDVVIQENGIELEKEVYLFVVFFVLQGFIGGEDDDEVELDDEEW